MAKTQCRKCGQVYEINKPGVFLCSACGETLPPVAIAVNEEQAPIAPAASPENKSRKGLYILLAVAVVVLLVAIAIGIGFYWGRNQDKTAERSSVSPLLTAQSTGKSISGNKESVSAKSEKTDSKIITLPGNVELQLNLIKAGSFTMGEDGNTRDMKLTKDFYMGVTEVTQGQYRAIMKDNPARFKGDDLPVECVTWHKAMEFCERLNEYAPDGWKFTLPTETQWEFACRAGSKSAYSWGDSLNGDKANCNGNYPYNTSIEGKYIGKTTPVKSYAPNAWGLYDMHGNVMEWCLDNYTSDLSNVKAEFTRNYRDSDGSRRVIRGGSWFNTAVNCRSASRSGWNPDIRRDYVGFRVALVRAD